MNLFRPSHEKTGGIPAIPQESEAMQELGMRYGRVADFMMSPEGRNTLTDLWGGIDSRRASSRAAGRLILAGVSGSASRYFEVYDKENEVGADLYLAQLAPQASGLVLAQSSSDVRIRDRNSSTQLGFKDPLNEEESTGLYVSGSLGTSNYAEYDPYGDSRDVIFGMGFLQEAAGFATEKLRSSANVGRIANPPVRKEMPPDRSDDIGL
jgi:hypothetical protein